MQNIILHDTESQEIIGYVQPIKPIDYHRYYDEVYRMWVKFDRVKEIDYSIEDFVDYHNENSEIKIDYMISDFIQL
jgi:hypothetical protein